MRINRIFHYVMINQDMIRNDLSVENTFLSDFSKVYADDSRVFPLRMTTILLFELLRT